METLTLEKFKKILKESISRHAESIHLNESNPIFFSIHGKENQLPDIAEKDWLRSIVLFLFASSRESLESGKPVQSILNVSQLGDLTLNAWKNSVGLRLDIFMPDHKPMAIRNFAMWTSEHQADSIAKINPFPRLNQGKQVNDPNPIYNAPLADIPGHTDASATNFDPTADFKPLGIMPQEAHSQAAHTQEAHSQEAHYRESKDDQIFSANQEIPEGVKTLTDSYPPNNKQLGESMAEPHTPRDFSGSQNASSRARVNSTILAPDQNQHNPVPQNPQINIIFDSNDPSKSIIRNGDFPIDALLRVMLERKASDMHLTMNQPIIYRIDGEIHREPSRTISPSMMSEFLLPILPYRNRHEFYESNDTDFAYELPEVGRFRVNMFRDNYGVGAVLRHIPSKVYTASQLNLPKAIVDFCALQKGLVLVTGPTGSGKSTTLAAMIDKINRERSEHILTIEDPIEFVHPQYKCLVNQREISRHTTSFKRALKAALREDPDVVLIGELRDLETIAIAIETAETGHLVFGTLHTNSAVSTVDRIIDQFPSNQQAQIRTMLASSLRGVIAQALIKKKTGGRVAAHEILVSDDAVASNIREGKNHLIYNTMLTQKAQGNQLMNESLLLHAKDGTIETLDAYLKSIDKKSFIEIAKRWGMHLPFLDKDGKLLAS